MPKGINNGMESKGVAMQSIIKGLGNIMSGVFGLVRWIAMLAFKLAMAALSWAFRVVGWAAGFNTRAPFLKTRIVALCLVAGLLQAPMYTYYAVKYPARATENISRMTLGLVNLRHDVGELGRAIVPDHIERSVDRVNNRYQVKAFYNTATEATGLKQVPWYHRLLSPFNLFKPKMGV